MKYRLILIALFAPMSILAQTQLWGTTEYDFNQETGTIFHIDGNGENLVVVDSFPLIPGGSPLFEKLVEGLDGKLYGTAEFSDNYVALLGLDAEILSHCGCGPSTTGIVFSFDTLTKTLDVIYRFEDILNGGFPQGGLIHGAGTTLYGLTPEGGVNDDGVIYKIDYSTNTFSKLADFDDINLSTGYYPVGRMVVGPAGKLYGLTPYGGANDEGVLYSFDTTSFVINPLFNFENLLSGANPENSLVYNNGNLFGVNPYGTALDMGNIFEYNISSTSMNIIYEFGSDNGANGSTPFTDLLLDINGDLMGLAFENGANNDGTIFRIDTSTHILKNLFDFDESLNGAAPCGGLEELNDGLIYGYTKYGGFDGEGKVDDNGILFRFNANHGINIQFETVFDFDGWQTGAGPGGSILQVSSGKTFGLTDLGGSTDYGTLFEFDITNNTHQKHINFLSPDKGANPTANLVQANNGHLYGMTAYGGLYDGGVIYKYDTIKKEKSVVVNFNGENGAAPFGSLTLATNGKLYGLTKEGRQDEHGTLIMYDLDKDSLKVLHRFVYGSEGHHPYGSLFEHKGFLYGMTEDGGIGIDGNGESGEGVIFRINLETEILTIIYKLDGEEADDPLGDFIKGSDGLLYAMTPEGPESANDIGVLFSFDPNGNILTPKHVFENATGSEPQGSLISIKSKLFGLSVVGGDNDMGTIFSWNLDNEEYKVLHSFDGIKGENPIGSLLMSRGGKLFGLTSAGGTDFYEGGTLFEFDTTTNLISIKQNFKTGIGGYPSASLIEIQNCAREFVNAKDYICMTGNYMFGSQLITSPGVYNETFSNSSGCDSIVTLTLTYGPNPGIVKQATNKTVCLNQRAHFSIIDTSFSSRTYQWQMNTGAGFLNILGPNYNGINTDSLTIVTALISLDNTLFRCIVNNACGGSDTSNVSKLNVQGLITNNSISSDQVICAGNAPALINGIAPSGGDGVNYSFLWQVSTTSGTIGFQDGASVNSNNDYTTGVLQNTTWVRRIVLSGSCSDTSNVIKINVQGLITNNTISSNQIICAGSAPALLNGLAPSGGDGLNYSLLWQVSTISSTIGFQNGASINSNNDYETGALLNTTWVRRIVLSGACSDTSNVVMINVQGQISNNNISSNQEICAGSTPVLLNGLTPTGGDGVNYSFLWQVSTISGTSGFQNGASVNSNNDYATGVLVNTTWVRRIVLSGACSDTSNVVKITSISIPQNATVSSTSVCVGENTNLTASCSGLSVPVWYDSALGGSVLGSGTFLTPTINTTVTYFVQCETTGSTNCVSLNRMAQTVQAIPVPSPEISSGGPYFNGDQIILTASGGSNYSWKGPYSFSSNQNPLIIPSASVFNNGTYTVTVTNPGCTQAKVSNVNIVVTNSSPCLDDSFNYFIAYAGLTPTIITELINNIEIQRTDQPTTIIAIPKCNDTKIESARLQLSGTSSNQYLNESKEYFSLYGEEGATTFGLVWTPNLYGFQGSAFDQDFVTPNLPNPGNLLFGPELLRFWVVEGNRTIDIPTLSGTSFCAGSTIGITINAGGTFDAGNDFKVLLSDEKGSFFKSQIIGKTSSPGVVNCVLPITLKAGNYKIKIISSAPVVASNIAINDIQIIPKFEEFVSPSADLLNINSEPKMAQVSIQANNKIDESSMVDYKASNSIFLLPGFEAQEGAVFHAGIQDVCLGK